MAALMACFMESALGDPSPGDDGNAAVADGEAGDEGTVSGELFPSTDGDGVEFAAAEAVVVAGGATEVSASAASPVVSMRPSTMATATPERPTENRGASIGVVRFIFNSGKLPPW